MSNTKSKMKDETCQLVCQTNIQSVNIMSRLWRDIEGVIKHYKWDVRDPEKRTIICISELTSPNYNKIGTNLWLGKNVSRIDIRFVGENGKYFKYDDILETCIHELAHMVYAEHDDNFYNFMDEIELYILDKNNKHVYQHINKNIHTIKDMKWSSQSWQINKCCKNEIKDVIDFLGKDEFLWSRFKNKYVYYDDYINNFIKNIVKYNRMDILDYIISMIGQRVFYILYDVKMKSYNYKGINKTKLVQLVNKMPTQPQFNQLSTCMICLDDVCTAKYFNCFHDICSVCVDEYKQAECPICRHSSLLL
jgi:hypothetical protein